MLLIPTWLPIALVVRPFLGRLLRLLRRGRPLFFFPLFFGLLLSLALTLAVWTFVFGYEPFDVWMKGAFDHVAFFDAGRTEDFCAGVVFTICGG